MLPLKRILHPTDFSESAQAALGYAAALARHYGAALHVLHVTPTFGDDPVLGAFEAATDERVFYRHLRDEADSRMRRFIEKVSKSASLKRVRVKRVHTHGPSPADTILEYAAAEAIDLVVMGTHGRRGVQRLMMGSVAETVARRAPCDVLTVRADAGSLALQRILVPVDLSERAEGLLRHVARLCAATNARLDVLHVVEPLSPSAETLADLAAPDFASKAKAHAGKQLRQLLGSVEQPLLSTEGHLREGRPASVIAEFAEQEGADLIVMATHGFSGLERLLIGSVTEQVLRIAPCPVWTVRVAATSSGPATEKAASEEAPAGRPPTEP